MSKADLSYGFPLGSVRAPAVNLAAERFSFADDDDTSLPSLLELIAGARVSESEVEEAIAQWEKDFVTARYKKVLQDGSN